MKKFTALLVMGIMLLSVCLFTGCSGNENVLHVYNWGDYMDESIISEFEAEYNCRVEIKYFTENEAMYADVKNSDINYDVLFPSDYMIEKMINEDMLLELDHSKISNLVNMDEAYMDASYDPGNKYSVPYMWGTVGILYNTEKVNGDITSWDVLFDEQYKGEVYMLDSVRDSLGVALLKLGYSMNERDESKVNEAKELLIKQKKDGIVRAYDVDNIKKDMASGIGTLGVVYSGDAVVAMADNEALSYALPEGGTNIWYDAVVIPKNSDNSDLAHGFIDFLCRGDIAKRNVDEIGYCTPNKLAYDMLDDEIKDDKRIYPDAQYIEKCEVFQDLGELTEKYDEMWMVITGS